eukprot:110841-Alexandrium_andersonii.AAC.1
MRIADKDGWALDLVGHPFQQLKAICYQQFSTALLARAAGLRPVLQGAQKLDWGLSRTVLDKAEAGDATLLR